MLHKSLTVLAAVSFLSLALVPSPAMADNKAEATTHFREGLKLIEEKDFKSAASQFERSVELYPTKNALFNLANCYKVLYQYGEALEALDKLKRLFKTDFDEGWIAELESLENELNESMASLEIKVDEEGAKIRIDGNEVGESPLSEPLTLTPGNHAIEVVHKELGMLERSVMLDPKTATVETFEFSKETAIPTTELDFVPEDESSKPKRVWTWVAAGVGGAAAIGAVITGSLSIVKTNELKSNCKDNQCQSKYQDDKDSAHALGTTANVLIGVAVAGAAAATVLFFLEGKSDSDEDDSELALTPAVSPDGAGIFLSGRF